MLSLTWLAAVASSFAGIADACPINRPEPSTMAAAKLPIFQIAIAALHSLSLRVATRVEAFHSVDEALLKESVGSCLT